MVMRVFSLLLAGRLSYPHMYQNKLNNPCSDTTAATLGWSAYVLCAESNIQAKLRQLVDKIEPGKAFLEVDDVASCQLLDGFIHEILRLYPPVGHYYGVYDWINEV